MADLGEMRSALSNGLMSLMKELYGKGPGSAKSFLNDEYVTVVLEGGLTRVEETLLADGKADVVREYRLEFQASVGDQFTAVVEQATGRTVLAYHSQMLLDPPRSFELFVLDAPPVVTDDPR